MQSMLVAVAGLVLGSAGLVTPRLEAQKKSCAERKCDRWAIKTSTVGGRFKVAQSPSLTEVLAFDAPSDATEPHAGTTHQTKRLAGEVGAGHEHEGTLIRVEGFLRVMQHDVADGDYHLQLSATWDDSTAATDVIVEIPDPEVLPDGGLKQRAETMRSWADKMAQGGHVSTRSGNLLARKTWVFVEGQLFFDLHHNPHCDSRGKRHRHAGTCWEIHPVTAIGFADKSHAP